MSGESTEVLIVGAGPVGLFLALSLVRRGVRVRVLEQQPRTKLDPRAAVIWPRAAEALVKEGLRATFLARASLLREASIFVRGRLSARLELGSVESAERLPWIIEQHDTERLLVDALAGHGVEIEWSCALEGLVDSGGRVLARFRDATGEVRHLESVYAVGCDGARSVVRKSQAIPFEGAAHDGVECLQINAHVRWRFRGGPSTCLFFLEPGATLLALALPTGGYRFVSFVQAEPGAVEEGGGVSVGEMQALLRRLTRDASLELQPTEPSWRSRARFQDRVAKVLQRGRVLLAGDAAHVWAPIGGRGMNLGLLDAENLAWRLAAVLRAGHGQRLLEGYSDEQRALALAVIRRLKQNRTEYPSTGLELALIGAAMPLASGLEFIRRRIETELSGLRFDHRGGSPWEEGPAAGSTRAGDRLPLVVLRCAGKDVESHALLSDGFTLLALETHAPPHLPPGVVRVREVRVADPLARRRLGTSPRWLLVRPDRHVALITRPGAGDQLDRFLARTFGAPPDLLPHTEGGSRIADA